MMNKIFYILLLSAILIGCRQTETMTANAPILPDGETKTAAIRVSETSANAAEPAIASDAYGNFYVVYVEHGAEKSADVYVRKFDSQMKAAGEKTRVNPNAGEATAWRGDAPTVKVGADETVYVGWTRRVETATSKGNDLCLSVSRDGGKSFAAPVKINDDTAPASHGMHSLAVGKDGTIFMAWLDERNVKIENHAANFGERDSEDSEFQFVKIHHNSNRTEPAKKAEKHETAEPNSEVFFAASNDGGQTFSANRKLASEVCPCCKTSLLAAPDGRIYASWRQVLPDDFRHIAVASSSDAGATFSSPAIVSDDRWKISACPVSGAALAMGENNQLKVAWFTGGDAGKIGLYAAESTDFAATFSGRTLISEGEVSGTPTLSANGDNLKIFWEDSGKIFQSALSANREAAKTELVAAGNLPSVAAFGGKIFAAYIKKENDKRAVWLGEL